MLKRKINATSGVELPSNLWYWLEQARVKSRQECRDAPRPCPCVSCKEHLLFQVSATHPGEWQIQQREIHEMEDTCRLDILERTTPAPVNIPLQSKPLPPLHSSCVVEGTTCASVTVSTNSPSSSPQK